MERMIPGRVGLACLSLFFTLHVCLNSVNASTTVDVVLGATARLPCKFSHTGNMALVQWFIESADGIRKQVAFRSSIGKEEGLDKDTPLTGRATMQDDMTLVIAPVKVIDQRSFFCQVTEGPAGASEFETNLRVFVAPEKPVVSENKQVIPLSPDNPTTHLVGKCTSNNGHPEPRIIWFKDSKPLSEVTDAKANTHYMVPSVVKESSGLLTVTSTLYLKPTKMDAKSVFHCTVEYSMPNGDIKQANSEPFNLTLLYPAENVIFKLLNATPIKEGDEVQMKCETDGNPQPQFEFTKDEMSQSSGSGLLILPNVTRSHSGIYKCDAMDFDAVGDLTKTLNLTVHYLDPVSVVPASPLMINKGDSIDLQCKTKSSDNYILSWMKDGKQMSKNGGLALQSTNLDNAGEYVCIAAVPSVPGLQKQASITVTISGQPEIDEPMTGKVAKQGVKVTLRCSARGYPAPQFTWKPSGKESLDFNGTKVTSIVELEATAAVLQDGVTCEATNKHGTDSKKFTVEIQSDNTIDPNGSAKADSQQGGSKGVVVAVLVCVLLLLLLVAALYFLGKRGNMACQKKENKEVESREVNDDIVVEMKSGEKPNEESGLLKKPHVEQ